MKQQQERDAGSCRKRDGLPCTMPCDVDRGGGALAPRRFRANREVAWFPGLGIVELWSVCFWRERECPRGPLRWVEEEEEVELPTYKIPKSSGGGGGGRE